MAEQKVSPQYVAGESSPFQMIVILAGLVTTAATLVAVYFINSSADVNVMGWYLDYVLPAGALLVGILAGSGYGAASWFTGLKIQRRLLVIVVVLQLLAYAGAEYAVFRSLGPLHLNGEDHILTFSEYFDFEATHFAWKQDGGKVGEPLGQWGYFFRLLELAGFACGGLVVPAALFKKPYCDSCKMYMRTRALANVAASIPARKVKASDPQGRADYERQQEEAFQSAASGLKAVCISGANDDVDGYRTALATVGGMTKGSVKLPKRMAIKVSSCKRCGSGFLTTQLITGRGKKQKVTEIENVALPAGFLRKVQ
jgi:hypothetical protein